MLSVVRLYGASLLSVQDFETVPLYVHFILGLLVAFALTIVFMRRWYFARRRILTHRITAEYAAPLKFSPAEMSYLFRRNLDERDFAATLIYMSQRGVIHFRKHEDKKVVLPGPKYEADLRPYERAILEVIDEHRLITAAELLDGYHSIFDDRKKGSFTLEVRKHLEKHGYIRQNYLFSYLESLAKGSVLSLLSIVWIPSIFLWFYGVVLQGGSDFSDLDDIAYTSIMILLILAVPILVFVIVVRLLQSRSLGRSWIAERKLKQFWPHIIGFRQFVYLSEKEKLIFESKSLKKASELNTLPYAVAFRLVENWREIIR